MKKKKEGVNKFLSSNTSYSARLRRGDIEDYMEEIDNEIEAIHKKIDEVMSKLTLQKMTVNIENSQDGNNNETKDNNNQNSNKKLEENLEKKIDFAEKGNNDNTDVNLDKVKSELKGLLEARSKLTRIRRVFHPPRITSVVRRSFEPAFPGGPPIPVTQVWNHHIPPMQTTTIESSYMNNTPAYSTDLKNPVIEEEIR